MAAIADAAAKRGIWVDRGSLLREADLRQRAAQPREGARPIAMRDRTLLAGSASKAYSMTGWRCGWILGPKEVVTAADTLQGHSTSNVASISQKAALQALTGSQEPVGAMLHEYKVRRDKLMEWFSADPRFECVKPAGAFYLFPRITKVLEATGMRVDRRFLADAARRGARGADGGRRLRCARLPPHLVRDVARSPARRHDADPRVRQEARTAGRSRALAWAAFHPGFSSRVAGIVGGPFVLQDAASLETLRRPTRCKQAASPDLVVAARVDAEVAALATLCNERARADGGARRRHRLHGRRGADAWRPRHLARAHEPHPGNRSR